MAELSTLGAVIKTAYEGESDTNAYSDSEKSKLSGIESGAQKNTVKPDDIPSAPGDIGAATAAQGDKADSAVQPGDLDPYAKTADVATKAQGTKADSAVQPDDLSAYAKTADLDLSGASVAANVATDGTVEDIVNALISAGLMASS